jgi:hypothetical protein
MPSTGSEVFVHARFVDGTTAVVGRYRFRRDQGDSNIGEFRYAGSWLRNAHKRAFALDPVNLPLSTQTFFATKRGGLFGALADTTPDRWGQRLLRLAHPHAASRPLSPTELLLATGDERVGCLAFSRSEEAPAPAPAFLPIGTRRSPPQLHRLGFVWPRSLRCLGFVWPRRQRLLIPQPMGVRFRAHCKQQENLQ